MALQNGTEVATGAHTITYYDVVTVSSGTATLTHTPTGTAGSEIGYVYLVNSDGTYGTTYTQAETAATGSFSYASGVITFATADAPADGESIACAYSWITAETAQKISLTSDGVPSTALVTAYGIARDICSGETFPCVLEGQVQIGGSWQFDLSADGDPVVQSVNMEFVKACLSNELYNFVVYTEEDE